MWIKSGNKSGQGEKIREEAWTVIVRERLSPAVPPFGEYWTPML